MAFKFVVLACLVAAASAGVAPLTYAAAPAHYVHSAPVAYAAAAPVVKAVESYDTHPQYSFAYDVQDGLTGDSKSQHESRDGDVVHGSYSVVDPDGTKRTVDYTADDHNGFNAVVRKEALAHVAKVAVAPVVAKVAAPVAYAAAPVVHSAPSVYHSAPSVYHSAPVAKYAAPLSYAASPVAYAAPVAKYAAPLTYAAAPAVAYSAAAPAVYHSAPAVYHSAPVYHH